MTPTTMTPQELETLGHEATKAARTRFLAGAGILLVMAFIGAMLMLAYVDTIY